MSKPIHLDKGVTYRGRIEAFAASILGKDYIGGKVKEGLQGQGFQNVITWMYPEKLPADWPATARDDLSGSGHTQAWVEGTWGKDSGDYPSGGSNWQVIDYWEQSLPANPDATTCFGAGYTCNPNDPSFIQECCPGNTCAEDTANVYGGGYRCMPSGPVQVNPPKQGTSVLKYMIGAVVAIGAVWIAWSYALPALGWKSKKNPTGQYKLYVEQEGRLLEMPFASDTHEEMWALLDRGIAEVNKHGRIAHIVGPDGTIVETMRFGVDVGSISRYWDEKAPGATFGPGTRVRPLKQNPVSTRWEIRVNDRRVQWSQQVYNRLFGKDKNSAVVEATTAEEVFTKFSEDHKPGLNRYYFVVFPEGTTPNLPY